MSHVRVIAAAAVVAVVASAVPLVGHAERSEPQWRLSTVAGIGEAGYSGDGGPATEARLAGQRAYGSRIAVAADGTLYVAEWANSRLRRVTPDGVIDTALEVDPGGARGVALAEDGTIHLSTDTEVLSVRQGGTVEIPTDDESIFGDIAVDRAGNVYYVADPAGTAGAERIGRVDRSGATTTVVDEQTNIHSIAVGPDGTLYFTTGEFEPDGPTVHAVGPDGARRTAATLPEGHLAGAVEIAPDGTPYVVDVSRGELLRIDPQGTVTRLGPSMAVWIRDVAFGPDNTPYLMVGATVRKLEQVADDRPAPQPATPSWADDAPGTVHRVAGTGETAATYEPGLSAPAVGPDGTVYVAQPSRNAVYAIDQDGRVERFAGTGADGSRIVDPPTPDGKKATDVALAYPYAVAADAAGNVSIATEKAILRVDENGIVSTAVVLERGVPAATFDLLHQIAVDAEGAVHYTEITDVVFGVVRKVGPDGTATTIAGDGDNLTGSYSDNAPAVAATLRGPAAVSVGPDGTVYVIETSEDTAAHLVRAVRPDGILVTVAGNSEFERADAGGFAGDGGPATDARLNSPTGVAAGPDGSIYIADTHNGRVRRVDESGVITTVAGNGRRTDTGGTGDGGPATSATLTDPSGLAVGPDGTLYVTSADSGRIRAVAPDGTISTFADLEPAPADRPFADIDTLAVGPDGTVYFGTLDGVRALTPDGAVDGVSGLTVLSPIAAGRDGSVYQLVQVPHRTDDPTTQLRRRQPDGTVVVHAIGEPLAGAKRVTVGRDDEVYVATATEVLRVTGEGSEPVLSTGDDAFDRDGAGAEIQAVTSGPDGTVYVVAMNQVVAVRDGKAERVAGNGVAVSADDAEAAEDGGPARDASLFSPTDVAVAADGTLFIATEDGVRRVSDGDIETLDSGGVVARHLAVAPSGDLYAASAEQIVVIVQPAAVTVDRTPWLWIWLAAGGVVLLAAALVLYRRYRHRPTTPDDTPEQ